MAQSPLISVIITVYNGETHLIESIHSIQQQTFQNFECVIVDDGSTDNTPLILQTFMENSKFQILRIARSGRIKALNIAWQASKGRYIAILDADDVALPHRLEKQVSYLQRYPNIGVLGSRCKTIDETGKVTGTIDNPLTDSDIRQMLVRKNPIVHSSALIRREVLRMNGGYNEQLPLSEDYDLWVRAAQQWEIANLPETLILKRKHSNAHFQQKKFNRQLHQTRMKIRWKAWRQQKMPISDLRFVFEPAIKWLYLQFKLDRTSR